MKGKANKMGVPTREFMNNIQKEKNRLKCIVLEHCSTITDNSGIYIFSRIDGAKKVAYVGQARHLLTRVADHLNGFQWIDKSLKTHGLYTQENKCGYRISFKEFPATELDKQERLYIQYMQDKGYELRNLTSGGQDSGKRKIGEWKPAKTYVDGLKQGYKNARKEVAKWFDKSLRFGIQGTPSKFKEKAYEKFNEFLNIKE